MIGRRGDGDRRGGSKVLICPPSWRVGDGGEGPRSRLSRGSPGTAPGDALAELSSFMKVLPRELHPFAGRNLLHLNLIQSC
ncbi:hypothetical protein Y1Q_0006338 [Alligator mississippiensis]|uniref:Uncharacterized protein n=1 Tax=Alligator mississippiensis TaxID=8496 RepID=A0A151NXF2_ALLMI|nr:hypothetical protein Y1Q_0006338 [Alligator mississippiensis]